MNRKFMVYDLTKPGRRLSLEAWGQTLLDLAADRGIGVRQGKPTYQCVFWNDLMVILYGDSVRLRRCIYIYNYTIYE